VAGGEPSKLDLEGCVCITGILSWFCLGMGEKQAVNKVASVERTEITTDQSWPCSFLVRKERVYSSLDCPGPTESPLTYVSDYI
jgi:hypothetical protein